MATLWQDVRYGFRMLGRSPGFTTIVVLILAIGIGANTAIFSVVNAVVLKRLPYRDSNRVVVLWEQTKKWERAAVLPQSFMVWREQNHVFESLAGYQPRNVYLTGVRRPREVRIVAVSSNLFSLLGVAPLLGRGFLPEEEKPGNDRFVVLSYAFWRDDLEASPDVVGKIVSLDGNSYVVVGVMPPDFEFPFARPMPFWVPLVLEKGRVLPLARLKRGVTLEQARAEMAVVADHLKQMDSKIGADYTIGVDRLLNRILKGNRKLLLLLPSVSGLVLLIACSNAANLYLARATVRQREMATRVALGASRIRILRQMLAESVVLSVGAGVLGLVLTFVTIRSLVSLCTADIPRLKEAGVDLSVLVFTLGLSVITGLIFGMVPAWRASDIRVSRILKEGGGRSGTGRGWRRLQGGLAIIQIGVSLILLAGAGLLIRSLIALQSVDLGFRPANVLAVHTNLPQATYPEAVNRKAFFEPLLQRVRSLPHVRSAALNMGDLDLGTLGMDIDISVRGHPSANAEEKPRAKWAIVGPGFFETMGIRLLKGRTFTDDDIRESKKAIVMVDENLARKYFPDTDPIGQSINVSGGESVIVGVVDTLRDFLTPAPAHDTVYQPAEWYVSPQMVLLVRTDGDPIQLAGALRAEVAALSKEEVILKIETLEATLAQMLAPQRFSMILFSLFAGIALTLAAVGVYGLLQYSTMQQTHDFGIRMALGASKIHILTMVMLQGLRLTMVGVLTGLAGALVLTRVLSSLLYDVTRTDPLTLGCVSLVLTGVALLASYLPARRATRIDPMVALRCE